MNRIESILLALAVFVVMASCSDSDNSIIDDPDISQTTTIDLSNPSAWTLASTPADLFPEASLMNNVDYGKNRALLAWYTIDRLFTQLNSHDAPGYIKNDLDGLSYPYAREVAVNEVFPDRELKNGESSVIETLNLSFYPRERGPYSLDGKNVDEACQKQHGEHRPYRQFTHAFWCSCPQIVHHRVSAQFWLMECHQWQTEADNCEHQSHHQVDGLYYLQHIHD